MTIRPNFPAIIGSPREFAIKVDIDKFLGAEWLYGKIGYIIGGHSIGNYNNITSLRDVLNQMGYILLDGGKRSNSRFIKQPKEFLFDTIWNQIYGDSDKEISDIACDECWAKHDITLPVDSFGGNRVYQFDEGEVSRIIWRFAPYSKDMVTYEVHVPLGTTEVVFSQLSDLLETLTDWEKSTRET